MVYNNQIGTECITATQVNIILTQGYFGGSFYTGAGLFSTAFFPTSGVRKKCLPDCITRQPAMLICCN